MKVKECSCYKEAMNKFLDKRLSELEVEIQEEVKKVLGLNFLGMTTQIFTDSRIRDIFRQKSGKFISTFILFNNPVVKFDGTKHVLHVQGCPELEEISIVKEENRIEAPSDEDQADGSFNIPID
ncbi:MAG: hypothetical protein EAX96_11385 [Candidatus Lokiarchaeota archaeon]|nr:hypothetical protein [Candidatus Lokiarchaeota archaeon]